MAETSNRTLLMVEDLLLRLDGYIYIYNYIKYYITNQQ